MWWYSASAWQHHSLKHLKDNLPIYPDDATFSQQFLGVLSDDVVSCTSKQNVPHEEEVRKQAKAAKQFLEEEQEQKVSQTSLPCSKTERLKLSSLANPFCKCHVKQRPIKSSKILKHNPNDDNE